METDEAANNNVKILVEPVIKILPGRGITLRNIDWICHQLEMLSLVRLRTLHNIIFCEKGIFFEARMREDIKNFSGFSFDASHAELTIRREILDSLSRRSVHIISHVLGISHASNKRLQVDKIMQFLWYPNQQTVDEYLQELKAKGKNSSSQELLKLMSEKQEQKEVITSNSEDSTFPVKTSQKKCPQNAEEIISFFPNIECEESVMFNIETKNENCAVPVATSDVKVMCGPVSLKCDKANAVDVIQATAIKNGDMPLELLKWDCDEPECSNRKKRGRKGSCKRFSKIKKLRKSGKHIANLYWICNRLEGSSIYVWRLLRKILCCHTKLYTVKKTQEDILCFSGLLCNASSIQVSQRQELVERLNCKDLHYLCDLLSVDESKPKEQVIERVLQFVINPAKYCTEEYLKELTFGDYRKWTPYTDAVYQNTGLKNSCQDIKTECDSMDISYSPDKITESMVLKPDSKSDMYTISSSSFDCSKEKVKLKPDETERKMPVILSVKSVAYDFDKIQNIEINKIEMNSVESKGKMLFNYSKYEYNKRKTRILQMKSKEAEEIIIPNKLEWAESEDFAFYDIKIKEEL